MKDREEERRRIALDLATRCDAHGKSDADVKRMIQTLRDVLAERKLRQNVSPPPTPNPEK